MLALLYITTILHVVLGVFTILTKRSKTNLSFSFFLIGISLWSLSNAFFQTSKTYEEMFNWALIAYTIATFMLLFLSLFSFFITGKKLSDTRILLITLTTFISFLIVYIPKFIIIGVDFESKSIMPGRGLLLLFLTYIYYIFTAIVNLKAGIKKFSSKKHTQLKYVSFGIFTAMIFGITFNLVLPSFNIYDFVSIGPSFTLISLSLVTYAIIKYQFLDIRFLFGRFVYYSVLAVSPYTIYFFLAYFYESQFGTSFTPAAYLIGIPMSYLFVISHNGLHGILSKYTTTRLINPGYDPTQIIADITNKISRELDLHHIVETITNTILRTVRPSFLSIYFFQENSADPIEFKTSDFEVNHAQLKDIKILFEQEKSVPFIVLNQDTEEQAYEKNNNVLFDQLFQKGCRLILPLFENKNVYGILVFGQKESDSMYAPRDIKFLSDITSSAGAGFQRARLYEDAQDFAKTLQHKVDEATAELKVKNTNLEDALGKLEEARRQERDMIDVMGHELRTPLTIVRNALSVMRTDFDKNQGNVEREKLDKYLAMALESARREMKLVETLLSATKFEGKRIQLHYTKIELNDVIADSIEALQYQAQAKNISINPQYPEQKIYVFADRVRAQEIVDNFLSNAIKYTPDNGHVDIKLYQQDNFGRVDIVDNGIGIAPEDLAKLGNKFFRAKRLMGEKDLFVHPSGTGLGLYVTFQLIEIMSGIKHVTSEVGKGSSFGFALPIYTDQPDKNIDQTFGES